MLALIKHKDKIFIVDDGQRNFCFKSFGHGPSKPVLQQNVKWTLHAKAALPTVGDNIFKAKKSVAHKKHLKFIAGSVKVQID